MLSTKMRIALVGVILSVGLAGCASKGSGSGMHSSSSGMRDKNGGDLAATTQGVGEGETFAEQDSWGRSQQELLAKRTFHFGFDRFDIYPDDQESVKAHAEYLASHPDKKIRIEGHTDQQGSREYNVALGERRSKSVSEILISHGVKPNQIKSVSYGEEKPVIRGTDENAYRQNRRAQIVYE